MKRKYNEHEVDLAYFAGVLNVVGLDGLSNEIKRLQAIGKMPHDIFTDMDKLTKDFKEKLLNETKR